MKAFELLSTPEKWTTGTFARNDIGIDTSPTDLHATCFCVLGALHACYVIHEDYVKTLHKVIKVLHKRKLKDNIANWNDSTNYEEVISVLKEANV